VLPEVLLISLVCLLKDIVYSVYTLFYTRMIGPNVKCLLLLLLPISLAAWPLLMLLSATISVIFGGMVSQLWPLDASIGKTICDAQTCVGDFWTFSWSSTISYMDDIRTAPCDAPFDITLLQLLVGTVQGSLCAAIETAAAALIGGIKLPLCICRVIVKLLFHAADDSGLIIWCCPCWAAAVALSPALIVLAYAQTVAEAFLNGPLCAVASYKAGGSLRAGFALMVNHIRDFDQRSTSLLCDGPLVRV
jgi:hypothetical protein